ncbi:MAG: ECF-type sigma factor [Pirellulaceae bacterium]
MCHNDTECVSASCLNQRQIYAFFTSDSNGADDNVTQLLLASNGGDDAAQNRLFEMVERELRIIARKQLRSERPDHSLQVTILVDDTLLELLGRMQKSSENRRHFYRTAAKKIRNLLIDHERKRRAQRRGGGEFRRVSLGPDQLSGESTRIDLWHLIKHLPLAAIDQRQSDIVELHHFGGCSCQRNRPNFGCLA